MGWRKPDIDDIYATLSRQEVEIYRSSADFTEDPIKRLLDRTVAMVRAKLRTNGSVRMSPDPNEIPESCISPAMDYLAFDILKRIDAGISEERKQARRDAISYFDQIAAGKVNPESVDEPTQDETKMSVTAPAASGVTPPRLLD